MVKFVLRSKKFRYNIEERTLEDRGSALVGRTLKLGVDSEGPYFVTIIDDVKIKDIDKKYKNMTKMKKYVLKEDTKEDIKIGDYLFELDVMSV